MKNRNTISIAIIDDEPNARSKIKFLLEQRNEALLINEYDSAETAYPRLLQLQPDILFLDVQMPGMSGIELLGLLKKNKPFVIFTTAFPGYAADAFVYDAVHYLLKPFDAALFYEAFERAVERLTTLRTLAEISPAGNTASHNNQRQSLAVKKDGKHFIVSTDQIDYITGERNNILLFTASGIFTLRETLTSIEGRLPAALFLRVHKSFIVNTGKVTSLEYVFNGEYILQLSSGKKIPSGRSYKESVERAFGL